MLSEQAQQDEEKKLRMSDIQLLAIAEKSQVLPSNTHTQTQTQTDRQTDTHTHTAPPSRGGGGCAGHLTLTKKNIPTITRRKQTYIYARR